MTAAEILENDVLQWAVAGRTLAGERVSGDLHVVTPIEGGALVAVIDGLGHGPDAAAASQAAAEVLSRRADESVVELMRLCHQRLRPTRGVAMSLASFDVRRSVMSWGGVGDVEGVLTSAADKREHILLRNGVIGYQLPSLRAAELPVARGDTLILATDGLRRAFTVTPAADRPPQDVADDILAQHGKFTDDALVLVVRYVGAAP